MQLNFILNESKRAIYETALREQTKELVRFYIPFKSKEPYFFKPEYIPDSINTEELDRFQYSLLRKQGRKIHIGFDRTYAKNYCIRFQPFSDQEIKAYYFETPSTNKDIYPLSYMSSKSAIQDKYFNGEYQLKRVVYNGSNLDILNLSYKDRDSLRIVDIEIRYYEGILCDVIQEAVPLETDHKYRLFYRYDGEKFIEI